MRLTRTTIVLVPLVALLIAASAGAALGPKQLYTKLLTSRYSPPSGYYGAKVGVYPVGERLKRNHAVGGVQVTLGGDEAVVYFFVFPTRTDALHYLRDLRTKSEERGGPKIVRHAWMGKIPGFKLPSSWSNMTLEGDNAFGKKVRNGLTVMAAAKQNVVVGAATIDTSNEESGDVPETIMLVGSGLKHLAKVNRQSRMAAPEGG